MGIPGLFRYLCKEFPSCINTLREEICEENKKNDDDKVYIGVDLNAVIHPVCQNIFGYEYV